MGELSVSSRSPIPITVRHELPIDEGVANRPLILLENNPYKADGLERTSRESPMGSSNESPSHPPAATTNGVALLSDSPCG
jgi:hypothetical protein